MFDRLTSRPLIFISRWTLLNDHLSILLLCYESRSLQLFVLPVKSKLCKEFCMPSFDVDSLIRAVLIGIAIGCLTGMIIESTLKRVSAFERVADVVWMERGAGGTLCGLRVNAV